MVSLLAFKSLEYAHVKLQLMINVKIITSKSRFKSIKTTSHGKSRRVDGGWLVCQSDCTDLVNQVFSFIPSKTDFKLMKYG